MTLIVFKERVYVDDKRHCITFPKIGNMSISRVLAWHLYGDEAIKDLVVHHKDLDTLNIMPDNLELITIERSLGLYKEKYKFKNGNQVGRKKTDN